MQERRLLHEKAELIELIKWKSANSTKGLDRSEVMAGNDVSTGERVYIEPRRLSA